MEENDLKEFSGGEDLDLGLLLLVLLHFGVW